MSTHLIQFYDPKKKRTELIPILILCPLKPRIVQINVGKNLTTLRMAPKWFELDDSNDALKNIRYPNGIREDVEHQYDVIARYRSLSSDETNDFIAKPIELNEGNTETLIVGLDDFVQQLGGELTFTNDEFTYEEATHRTACGVANLSSAHLLAANYLSTAEFHFLLDLDYSSDLARTNETMQNFILNFSDSIAYLLQCPNDYVRVNSLQKPGKKRRETTINFGLTTPDLQKTEELAQQLQVILFPACIFAGVFACTHFSLDLCKTRFRETSNSETY